MEEVIEARVAMDEREEKAVKMKKTTSLLGSEWVLILN